MLEVLVWVMEVLMLSETLLVPVLLIVTWV